MGRYICLDQRYGVSFMFDCISGDSLSIFYYNGVLCKSDSSCYGREGCFSCGMIRFEGVVIG
jgi:hypothetical protein